MSGNTMNKKRMLIYAHYFYPDVASTAQILTELCQGLQDIFNITVICVVPSYGGTIESKYKDKRYYNEIFEEINIIRVRVPEFNKKNKLSRIRNIVSYFLNSIAATFKVQKQDYILSISQPPILGGVLGVIGKLLKRGKLIYNIQDFNPEQMVAISYSKNKLLISMLLKIDKFSCRLSNKIIVVGRDMQETLKKRFNNCNTPKNVFINNWIDEKSIYPLEKGNKIVNEFKEKYNLMGKFIIMYSGNIGLYYDLRNIVKVIARFKERNDVVFTFIGDGTIKNELINYKEQHCLENVIFIPYQDKKDLNYSLNAADVHWVVNAKGIKGVSVPSKLYGVMASGKPVLGVLESGSEGRQIIEESKCGICAEPADYEQIYRCINYMIDNKNKINTMGKNGREYLVNKLSKNISIKKYKEEILSV